MILTKRRFSLFRMVVLGAMLILLLSITSIPTGAAPPNDLLITGVLDGPLTGGIPKMVELYAINAIPDLSMYGLGSANNGGGTDGEEFTFPAVSVDADTCIWIASEGTGFASFFGFDPDYTTGAMSINGDDAIELFYNGTVSDVFGEISVDGTGQSWEYTDGWAYRAQATGPDGFNFIPGNWSYSGPNALDGETTNATAATPFPTGTYPSSGPCALPAPPPPPPPPPPSGLVINELLADPASGLAGDANGDGTRDGSQDEFIELVNDSGGILDISGWTISDAFSLRHTFPSGTVLPDQCAIVVFGGGTPTGAFGGALVQTSSVGFVGLNNGGDTITVNDGSSDVVSYSYGGEGGNNQSLTRDPDLTGADPLVQHSTATGSGGALFSPGSMIDGSPFGDCGGGPAPEVYINELRINKSGAETDFFEIQGASGTNLNGLTYIVLSGEFEPGQVDYAIDLSGTSIPGDGFFVAGGANTASTYGITPDLSVEFDFFGSPSTHMIVHGFYGASGDDLDTNNDGTLDITPWFGVVDAVSLVDGDSNTDYSYSGTIVGPDGSFTPAGTYRCTDAPFGTFDNNQLSFGSATGTPGFSNVTLCDPTKIHDIQGSGSSSPLVGVTVLIEGIVVGDFQDDVGAHGDLNGFFVQEEDADADGDPATSEGIFVFQGSNPAVDVAMGDLVRVEGPVSEFFGDTQITSFSGVSVLSSGNPLPTVTEVLLPVTAVSDFEAFEGMYVTLPQALVISEFFNFDRFGEIVLTTDRQFQPTAVFEPGSVDAANLAAANALSRITLDDGRTNQNPDPAIHPNGLEFGLTNLFRGGDTVADVTGVINYAFGLYRVQPTQGGNYTAVNLRSATPDSVAGNVTVASFNVLNYFTTLDAIQETSGNDPADDVCGPLADTECRGADGDQPDEFARQRAKIIAALAAMDADVVGLIEIENHPTDAALADLVSGLNDTMGPGTYDYVATGPVGPDVIRVAFIYKPASVSPLGAHAVLDTPAFLDPNNLGSPKNRAALAQTFSVNSTGGVFTAVINHFKSKGSGCGAGDDHPEAGSCNLTRTLAAQELLNWLAADPTASFDEDFIILGDLNAYDKEDPIDVLLAGGYTDLAFYFEGEYAYSYVFNGQLGYLDYALANAALLDEVTGVTEWHINADEADLIDYDTSFKKAAQDAIYAPDAYRSSDHDPVFVGMELTTEAEIFEMIGVVEGLVEDGVLNNGQGNSLLSKLENILAKLGEGKTKAAVNQLGAFINELESFVAEGVLTPEQAAPLIQSAEVIVAALSD